MGQPAMVTSDPDQKDDVEIKEEVLDVEDSLIPPDILQPEKTPQHEARKKARKNAKKVETDERKALGVEPTEPITNPKVLLDNAMKILIERPLKKGELKYVVESRNGASVATLTIHCFDNKTPVYVGEAVPGASKESKKLAERNAAETALEAYKEEIEEKTPQYEASQRRRKQTWLDQWKALKKAEEERMGL